MTIQTLLHSFVTDKQFQTVAALIIIDLVLGTSAAVKLGTFRLTYLSNFARNDVLGKVVPFFVLHSAALVAGGTNVVIPGVDLANMSTAVFGLVSAAMVGSILSSLKDFGVTSIPEAIGGHTPPQPPPPPAPVA